MNFGSKSKLLGLALCAGLLMLPGIVWGNVYVLNLNGTSGYVWAADSDNLSEFTDGSFTVQAWIFVQSFAGNMPVISKWEESTNNRSWAVQATITGQLRLFMSSDGSNSILWQTTIPVVFSDTWHHVAVVVNPGGGDEVKFYVDNVEYAHSNGATSPPAMPYNNNAQTWVGRFNAQYFYGYIDEVRLYDGILSSFPSQVDDLPLTADSNTEILYHFDYPSGNIFDYAIVGGNPTNTGFLAGGATRIAWNNLGPGNDIPLPVTLVSMSAISADALVKILWSTESEYDNLGFHIYRATNEEGPYTRITSDMIASQGFTSTTQNYQYNDQRDLINGVTYFYKLSDIDVNGRERTHQVVVSATPVAEVFMPGEDAQLAGYQLSQNYPNPFNSTTTIRYYVRDNGQVRLSVFNLNGEEVTRLVDDTCSMGEYFIEFDAANLPTGIYFLRLVGDNGYDNIKKMLFLK
ncbi:T9SS type A sorting domain-containing protein [bacterium]|nr:T9SS type A sorting domain-containing protein [bacterium]